MKLTLENKNQPDTTQHIGPIIATPEISESYWAYRVRVSDTQAIIGFPKFGTIGIGFAVEDDWNTNLPYRQPAEKIYAHIQHNKGDDEISGETCLEAIRMIQSAAREDPDYGDAHYETPWPN